MLSVWQERLYRLAATCKQRTDKQSRLTGVMLSTVSSNKERGPWTLSVVVQCCPPYAASRRCKLLPHCQHCATEQHSLIHRATAAHVRTDSHSTPSIHAATHWSPHSTSFIHPPHSRPGLFLSPPYSPQPPVPVSRHTPTIPAHPTTHHLLHSLPPPGHTTVTMGCPNTSFITGYVLITFFSVAALGITPIAIIGAVRAQGYTTLIAAETVLAISILLIIVRESTLCCGARPARAGGKVASLCARPFSVGGSGLNVGVIVLHTLALVLMIAGVVQACNYFNAQCSGGYNYYWNCNNSSYIFMQLFGVPPIVAVGISLFLLCWLACPCCDAAQQDNSQVEQKALETRIEMEVVARVQAQLAAAVQQIGQQQQQQQQQVMVAVPVQSYLPAGQGRHVVGYAPQWSTQQPPTPINSAFLAGDVPSEQYNYGGEGMVGETQPDN